MKKHFKTPKRHLLRPEANPVTQWRQFTEDQRHGLVQLLEMLWEASETLGQESDAVEESLPWLSKSRRSQLAFIDGARGTGKSTLLLSLVRLLQPSTQDDGFCVLDETREFEVDVAQAERTVELARALRGRVVLVEPLDMEPLPKGTPILTAILARLWSAVSHLTGKSGAQRGLLDSDVMNDRESIRFRQFQTRIARSLDSNLNARRGALDRDQYGEEVLNQEEERLELYSQLEEVLSQLSDAVHRSTVRSSGGRSTRDTTGKSRLLFLVPIDDVDLNPDRCLELLRILRSYSPPQFFFLLMGQYALVESIVKLEMGREFQEVRGKSNDIGNVSLEELRTELAEVASANLQKMVPRLIPLRPMSLTNVLDFRPISLPTEGRAFVERATLGSLFQQVVFRSDLAERIGIHNLLQLVNANNVALRVSSAAEFALGDYPALGAFQIPVRRLVDLWQELSLLLARNGSDDKGNQRELMKILQRHWDRLVDEATHLKPLEREQMRRDRLSACESVDDYHKSNGRTVHTQVVLEAISKPVQA